MEKTLTITTTALALLTSGGNFSLSLFDIPELRSQPASRSLPSIRWLFSRGSHIFPTNTMLACGGYLYLAYASLPARGASNVGDVLGKVLRLLSVSGNGVKTNGYLAAAVLCFGTAAFTSVMVPTNFALIEKNEQQGGARSQANAQNSSSGGKSRSANESVSGEGQESQFTDLSGPQTKTSRESSEEEDREVQALLERFGKLNLVRAGLLGAGGVVGLWTALA